MAEDKKPTPGKDLASKIATAYRNMPADQQGKPSQDSNDIQNPDLDQAFDKMVEMYKVRRPERENTVVTFPAPPSMRVPTLPAEQGEEYECPECGHNNPAANQFCGMCGAAREDVLTVAPAGGTPSEAPGAVATAADGAKHYHHYYHYHHYRNNPYLLLAVVLLLGVIAWQQWREYQQRATTPVSAPAVKAQPQQPAPAPSNPSTEPAAPAAVPPPVTNVKPAKKPVSRPNVQPAAQPVQRGEPPGPQARVPEASPPFQILPNQTMPALPSFPSTPSKPVTKK